MEIVFHSHFKKRLKKLPEKVRNNLSERLEIFTENKFNEILNNHSVEGAYPNCRSINITGDYRAIYEEKDGGIIFRLIGTHSELY